MGVVHTGEAGPSARVGVQNMPEETDVRVGNQSVAVHLESALRTDDSAQKNYHVRQAMQLLIAAEDSTAVGD